MRSFLEKENLVFSYIKSIQVKGFMKLRKIFTLKQPLSHFDMDEMQPEDEDLSMQDRRKLLLPKDVAIGVETFNVQIDYPFVMATSTNKYIQSLTQAGAHREPEY